MKAASGDAALTELLDAVARDEARFCAMLSRHVGRLGGTPSRATGAFYDKVMALDSPAARLALLNRGQDWVVRRLREATARIADGALLTDLGDMLEAHRHNIDRCEALG